MDGGFDAVIVVFGFMVCLGSRVFSQFNLALISYINPERTKKEERREREKGDELYYYNGIIY